MINHRITSTLFTVTALLCASPARAQTEPAWERLHLTGGVTVFGVGAGLGDLQGPTNPMPIMTNFVSSFGIVAPLDLLEGLEFIDGVALHGSVGTFQHSLGDLDANITTLGLVTGGGIDLFQALSPEVAISISAGAGYMLLGSLEARSYSSSHHFADASGLVTYGELALHVVSAERADLSLGVRADVGFVLPDAPLLVVSGMFSADYAIW